MTRDRSTAYGRVVQTIREIGPAKLWPREEACVRHAADALLFSRDLVADPEALEALGEVMELFDNLVDADRWTPERARRLLDDVWACGPAAAVVLPVAA
jgi:hypothetical protein